MLKIRTQEEIHYREIAKGIDTQSKEKHRVGRHNWKMNRYRRIVEGKFSSGGSSIKIVGKPLIDNLCACYNSEI